MRSARPRHGRLPRRFPWHRTLGSELLPRRGRARRCAARSVRGQRRPGSSQRHDGPPIRARRARPVRQPHCSRVHPRLEKTSTGAAPTAAVTSAEHCHSVHLLVVASRRRYPFTRAVVRRPSHAERTSRSSWPSWRPASRPPSPRGQAVLRLARRRGGDGPLADRAHEAAGGAHHSGRRRRGSSAARVRAGGADSPSGDNASIRLFLDTGMRLVELANLTVDDLDPLSAHAPAPPACPRVRPATGGAGPRSDDRQRRRPGTSTPRREVVVGQPARASVPPHLRRTHGSARAATKATSCAWPAGGVASCSAATAPALRRARPRSPPPHGPRRRGELRARLEPCPHFLLA